MLPLSTAMMLLLSLAQAKAARLFAVLGALG